MTHKIFWNQKPKTDCPKNLKKKPDFLKNEIRKTNLSETKIWKPTFEIRIRKLIKIQNFLETKNRKTIFEIRFSKLQNKIRKRIAKFYETKNRKIDFLKTKPNICDFQNWKKIDLKIQNRFWKCWFAKTARTKTNHHVWFWKIHPKSILFLKRKSKIGDYQNSKIDLNNSEAQKLNTVFQIRNSNRRCEKRWFPKFRQLVRLSVAGVFVATSRPPPGRFVIS